MTHLGILVASNRPQSIGARVAGWVEEAAGAFDVDRIDLGSLALPAFDEPYSPKAGREPEHEHTRAWARRVTALDAAVIVTPQYNGSYPGVLKNAVDFLYAPWNALPVLVVGYGWGRGGEVIGHLTTLLERVEADHVGSVGLGFREDLSPEGELFVRPDTARALSSGLATLTARGSRSARAGGTQVIEC
ncbi:NADPH-dependent FMN reductase [Brachybacterium hainanense]|uniref:NADPH-dependent FMN reductase n=1 Tax=Brachybacterium hainanense TaxID=1541174 RepID=A0ABV6RB37_9MICO